jgi:hypothetical protein
MRPLPRGQALRLERAQQRVHRVGVHRQRAAGQLADPLDELVAVARLDRDVVEHQQRQQPRPAQVADQRIARDGRVGDVGPRRHVTDHASARR